MGFLLVKKDFKYFIGCEDGKKVRHFCVMLPKMSAYWWDFTKTSTSFLITIYKVLEKYNEIYKKVSNVIKRGFDYESVYKDKYLKTKIKSYKSHHKFSWWWGAKIGFSINLSIRNFDWFCF